VTTKPGAARLISLFAHHMALLGPHPARWYSLPILRPVRIG